jgi:TolA-binding protein
MSFALKLNRWNSKFARGLAVLVVAAALAGPVRSQAATRQDSLYTFATNLFVDGNYQQAEIQFNKFVTTYTNSARLTNALLFLARARYGESNYAGALELLTQKLPADDPTVLNYTALAYDGAGNYSNAVASCVRLLLKLPANSPSRLPVARLEALALSQLQDWPGVIAFLSNPDGDFQKAARLAPGNPEAVNGYLLLGEAYWEEKRFAEGELAVRQANTNALGRELSWKRDFLLARILLDAGRTEEALTNSLEMAALQANSGERVATAFLRGEILERLDRPAGALAEYTNNLAPGLPPEAIRKALAKTVELSGREEAIQSLDNFIAQRPKDPNLDLAHWYLGDLHLKMYFAAPSETNALQRAVTNLAALVQDFPASELLGQARLDLGWGDWAQGKFAEAKTNFLQAVERLPYSEARAEAILKLADAQFKEGLYQDAARHYNQLLTDYATMASVTNRLFDRALYQLAQADLELGDEKGAEEAAARIVNGYRDSGFGERSLLLLGENFIRTSDYARARERFSNLLAKYPDSPLQPDVQFEIARTYEQEGDWSNALNLCESWLANPNFATNALLPQVQFARALDSAKAGQETNALAQMTNFVSQYQSNSPAGSTLAPLAQMWIGDYYLNHGDYAQADFAYENLWVMFPKATGLVFRSRLSAGRAAQAYDLPQASNDFSYVIANTNTSADLKAEAWFQLGYTDFLQFQAGPNLTNNNLFGDALTALSHATNGSPSNALAPQALGQMGNCWLALAPLEKDPAFRTSDLAKAAQMFQDELVLPQSDVTARSQAECGLGLVEQALDHPQEALTHYLRVVYPGVIYDETLEKPDPVWVKEAGVAAVQLYYQTKDWADAITVYNRVKAVVPTLGGELDKKIANAASKMTGSGN